jgi:hypothetical protein
MYMPNDAGGFVVLTTTACEHAAAVELGYEYRAYATEDPTTTVIHEGCWFSPSTADAAPVQGFGIIPVVNTWWVEGGQATFTTRQFSPQRLRWPETSQTIKPTV